MNPRKVIRSQVKELTDLPNVGPATARDLRLLGIDRPEQLAGCDPYQLYQTLCEKLATRLDPCVLDVLMSVVDFASGGSPRSWWEFTSERKRRMAGQ